MSRKRTVLIVTGVLVAAGAVAAVSAQAYRGHHGHGSGMSGRSADGWLMGEEGGRFGHGGSFGRWGKVTRDSFDARVRETFARVDANSDGVVDAAEIDTALKQRGERYGRRWHARHREGGRMGFDGMGDRFQGYDVDRDGKITKDEFLGEVRRRFALMDLDSDGKITDADLPPMMRGRDVLKGGDGPGRFGGMGRMSGGRMISMLRQADADKDGVVTLQEVVTSAEARFARFDHSKDSTIDASDREALSKEARDYRVKRILHRFGASQDGSVTREQAFKVAGEMFQRMDRNGDGVISRDDRRGEGKRHGRWGGRGSDRSPDASKDDAPGGQQKQ